MAPTKAKKAAKPKAPKAKKSNPKADKAAKVKSATKGTKPVQAPPQPEEPTIKLPGAKAVLTTSNDFEVLSDRARTAAGKAGKFLSEEAKRLHLNAKEFRRAHALRMIGLTHPEKLRSILSDADYYRQCLSLDKLAGLGLFEPGAGRPEMPPLHEDEDEGNGGVADETAETEPVDETEPEEREDADNIHRLGRGRDAA